jgi:hypothetical protein
VLQRTGADVSGLYIGDYHPDYVARALVRHSIYANKILLVDPFIHPYILSSQYNPIENPEQYRAQTLRNVNFYLSLLPWIDAGIVEFIRTPADFDRQLNFDAMKRSRQLFENTPDLRSAAAASVQDLTERHSKNDALHDLILSAPDGHLRRVFNEIKRDGQNITEADFIEYVNSVRAADPNFLEPLGVGENNAQLRMVFAGGTYEIARLAAQMTRSYLFTDLQARWAAIEHDRRQHTAENAVWSPFAKAVQNTKLYYLNNLRLDHALKLRSEQRLESVRAVLTSVWDKMRGDEPFDERNAVELANRLTEAVNDAEAEWLNIRKDVVKFGGGGIAAGIASAADAAITSGHAMFMAAAAVVGSATFLTWSRLKEAAYLKKYPASFFMDLQDK